MIHELNGPGRVFFPLDEPFFLEGFQVAHDAVGRLDVERLADLAHRGAVATVFNLVANELVDLALTFGELAEIRHGGLP